MLNVRSLALGAVALLLAAGCGGGGGGGGNNPPSNLTYFRGLALFGKGVPILPSPPGVSGNVTTWSVNPPLPAGLSLDPANGAIIGTPSALSDPEVFTVRASNAFGFVDETIEIGVVRPALLAIAGNSNDDTLSTYLVDALTGQLVPTGYSISTPGADYPRGMAVHSNGRYVYVVDRISNGVTLFDVDLGSGNLTARATVPTVSVGPNEIIKHPSEDVFYVIERSGAAHVETFTADPNTGDLTSVASLPLTNGPETAVTDSQGRFLWVANLNSNRLHTLQIDALTHVPADTGASVGTSARPISMVVSRGDRFLYSIALDGSRIQVFAIDDVTGVLTLKQTLQTGLLPARLVIDPAGRFLYVAISSDDTIRTYRIDQTTGLLSQIATTPAGQRPGTVVMDPTGSFLYTTEIDSHEVGVYAIDFKTGALLRRQSMRARSQPIYLAIVPGDDPAAPKADFAYVANSGSGDLSMYSVDPLTGDLASVSNALPVGALPQALARHPNGRWVFAAHTSTDEVAGYEVDPLSGELSSLGAPTAVGDMPTTVAIEPSGRFLYALDQGAGDVQVLSIDPLDGSLTVQSSTPTSASPSALAIDPSGRFAVVSNATANTIAVFQIAQADGALTALGVPAPITGSPTAVTVHPSGRYLLTTFVGTGRLGLFAISAIDGALTQITTKPSGTEPSAIAIEPFGRYLYVCNRDSAGTGDVTTFKLDPSTEVLTRLEDVDAGTNPIDAAVDPSGRFVYVVNENSNDVTRLLINSTTGKLSAPTTVSAGVTPRAITLVGKIQ